MKNKMKNKCAKILTMIICMVSIVTALVIVPSADSYDDNLTHYWLYFTADHANNNLLETSTGAEFSFEAPFYQKCSFIYYRLPNGQNLFTSRTFKKLSIYISNYYDEEGGLSTLDFILFFDISDMFQANQNTPQLQFSYQWNDSQYLGLTIYGYNLHPDYPIFEYQWLSSYGNYNLQLWLDSNYVTNINSSGEFNFVNLINSLCRYSIISHGKTYSEGYNTGFDSGLEEGYNNGYDQGSIDGYQQGYTEGETIGYNDGYELGYSDGNGDGYSLGYDEGEAYGWANGFGAGQNDMAETSHFFKEMVFAIFDAPSRLIDSMLNFDIFGINLVGLVKTIITLAVVAVILVILLTWLL